LNMTNKVFAKILYDRLLPCANTAVQHYQASNRVNRQQILKKCNELNITTHHLFNDFKAAYDTIIRNEVYVGIKFTIHNTLIRPVLLYGSETWVLTKREENQLLVFKRKVLRTICCPKIKKDFISPNALNFTKTSRLRFAFRMIRSPEDLPQKSLLKAKPN
jgi:hypothetical protein